MRDSISERIKTISKKKEITISPAKCNGTRKTKEKREKKINAKFWEKLIARHASRAIKISEWQYYDEATTKDIKKKFDISVKKKKKHFHIWGVKEKERRLFAIKLCENELINFKWSFQLRVTHAAIWGKSDK